MTPFAFSLVLVGIYASITYGLSALGMKHTSSLKTFAVGRGDMSPILAGITMAASIASTATFVINPGFVYADGLSAWAHYGLAAMLGLIAALILVSKGFQRLGNSLSAVTLPAWIERRYKSRRLGLAFAALMLLYVTFVVLILAGSAIIVEQLFGLSYHLGLVTLLLFCFGYVLMGGTYAHAYTNAFQGALMVGIAFLLFFAGAEHIGPGFSERLAGVSESFSSWVNPSSDLYNSFFAVFVSSFLVTFALMLQPHIVTKVLYLKESPGQLSRFLAVAIGASVVFSLVLFVGFWARLDGLVIERQDAVVVTWIAQTFNPFVVSFLLVSLLAAGMSTLDGILVSISAIVVADLVPTKTSGDPASDRRGLVMSRWTVVLIGLVSLALAWSPPARLGLFAQQGVYALVAASCVPVLFGIFTKRDIPAWVIGSLSLLAVGTHFTLRWLFDVVNPSVSASVGILLSLGFGGLHLVVSAAMEKTARATTSIP